MSKIKKYGAITKNSKPWIHDYTFDQPSHIEDEVMGWTEYNARRVWVVLSKIKTPGELFETLEHEDIHAADEDEDFFGEEEHKIIDAIAWMKEDIYTPTEVF